MKSTLIKFKYIIATFLLLLIIGAGSKTTFGANTNTTLAKAKPINIDSSITETVNIGNQDMIYYYKLTIPKNIGNQYITISLTNYADDDLDISLCNNLNKNLDDVSFIDTNQNGYLLAKTEGGAISSTIPILTAGSTYYIKVSNPFYGVHGDYVLSVTTTSDDNWGTFDKAQEIKSNQLKSGKIEYDDDIDMFYINLPKDNKKYNFIISADDKAYALFANSNRIKIGDTCISANSTDNSFSAVGKGQRIYIRMEADNNNTKYTIKVVPQKKTISKLKLTKYKKGSKKIVGSTIKNATVKITINKKIYTIKSNSKGTFSVKLKKKLKAKQKIKVTVSNPNYKTKKKTFKVK